jgi:hypothetical protein
MKSILTLLVLAACVVFLTMPGVAQNKYVGVKVCSPCHKASTGDQFGIWSKSLHAQAFKNLQSKAADEIAKKKGLKTAAAASPECLECHVTPGEPKLQDDGVGCEVCHGPGSNYKSMSVMKDKAKAIAAGLVLNKDEAAMEKACKKCHNEKSPTFKSFDIKKMWDKIKHPVIKK